MALPPQFLDEIRARLPLSDVVGKRLRLIRAGREYKAPCPFHKEKTPSFYVNDQKGFFHCFGCGAHGDVIGFVMRHDNLSFPEAIEQLAGMAGLDVPRASPEERQRYERQKSLHDLMEAATAWFQAQLRAPAGREALAYLKRRGLDDRTIDRFRLGYAPADSQALPAALERQGFKTDDLIAVGLLARPDDGRRPYAFFRNRVMFPIADGRGRIVAFGGRIIAGDGPKYVNSAESPIFRKGELLYNAPGARAAAARGQPVMVVEGYLDVIALAQFGFDGAVAPLGTALTEAQLRTLWTLMPAPEDGVRAPVLCFDGDAAGLRAAQRASERALPLIGPDQTVRFVFLPQGEDPDSLLRRPDGVSEFRARLDAAQPLVDFLWHQKLAEARYDTPEERAALRKYFLELVAPIEDRTLQQLYRSEFLDRCYGLWRPGGGGAAAAVARVPRATATKGLPAADVVLVAILIHHPGLLDEYLENLELIRFPKDGFTHTVFRYAARLIDERREIDGAELRRRLAEIDSEVARILVRLDYNYRTHVNLGGRDEEYVRSVFVDALRREQLRRLMEEVEAAEGRRLGGVPGEDQRIAALRAEVDRLLSDENYLLEQDPAPYPEAARRFASSAMLAPAARDGAEGRAEGRVAG